jgi:hypothetical protein
MKINYFRSLILCFSLECGAKFHTHTKEQIRLVLHRQRIVSERTGRSYDYANGRLWFNPHVDNSPDPAELPAGVNNRISRFIKTKLSTIFVSSGNPIKVRWFRHKIEIFYEIKVVYIRETSPPLPIALQNSFLRSSVSDLAFRYIKSSDLTHFYKVWRDQQN